MPIREHDVRMRSRSSRGPGESVGYERGTKCERCKSRRRFSDGLGEPLDAMLTDVAVHSDGRLADTGCDGVPETCGNGIDDDCDGKDDECGAGEICEAERCQPDATGPCVSNLDCPNNTICTTDLYFL